MHWFSCRVRGGRLLPAVLVRQDGLNPLSCGLSDSLLQVRGGEGKDNKGR